LASVQQDQRLQGSIWKYCQVTQEQDEALRLAPDFNPEGWKRPEPRPKKPKPPPSVNKEEDEKRKKDKAKGKKSSKPVTERQQLKALGVRMEGYVTSLQRPRNAAPRVVASFCRRWALA
jgi:hypothetical protein